MADTNPILIYGASGFTGRCCVQAAEDAGIDYLIGGRSREKLAAVAGPRCLGVRVADATDPGRAFAGVGCVVSTVGPFARLGLPVLDAAIEAGAHYVDTTAEQSFMQMALTRHTPAEAAGITALPACGVEYAPMLLAAALLPPGAVRSYLWLDDFLPTRGSVSSMITMAGVGPTPWPTRVRVEERKGHGIRIPGAEEVFLHPDCETFLVLRYHEALPFSLLWPLARWMPLPWLGDQITARLSDPTPAQRAQARFTVVVQQGTAAIRLDGADVYASTGRFAVTLGAMLAGGQALRAGVLPVGAALPAEETLERLGLSPRRVSMSP